MAPAQTTRAGMGTPECCTDCPLPPNGTQECHCGACGRHFSVVGHFDRHRKNGKCLDPSKIGLVLRQRRKGARVWVQPDERITL